MTKRNSLTLLVLSLLASPVNALTLPSVVGDNMVLQQNADCRLWGRSVPGDTVTVSPSWGIPATTAADSDGRWELSLPTPSASFDPKSFTVADSRDTLTVANVLIGEVWFCSGQSNMEMPLRGFWTQPVEGAARAVAYSGKYPGIRMFSVPKTISYEPLDDVDASWKESIPSNAPDFGAVPYFFARSLTDILGCPVGIINSSYGGSKVEGWVPEDIIARYPRFDMEAERRDQSVNDWERVGVMYNAMLYPLRGYTVRGFLWNQGESNVGRHDEYPDHLRDMVGRWRADWNQGELPFYFVEIPGWNYGDPDGIDAALFRESQHRAASLIPSSGIVVTSDLVKPDEVDDIHASRKMEIGERLAFMAANRTYGHSAIPATYPRFRSMTVDGDRAVLSFHDAPDGFTPNDRLEGFEVAGSDGVFHRADATEDYDTRNIIVIAPEGVDRIREVRYCFRNFAIGKVFDLMGMPLVPFRAVAD